MVKTVLFGQRTPNNLGKFDFSYAGSDNIEIARFEVGHNDCGLAR
ncbi:MAG: hypothetical protein PHD43_18790 [Methylococcales bacterium]|nr:hypothetical protein [Methylococcales bacterium]